MISELAETLVETSDPHVIRRLQQRGWTQVDLAKRAGISRLMIVHWARERRPLRARGREAWACLRALEDSSEQPPSRPLRVLGMLREPRASEHRSLRLYVRADDVAVWDQARALARDERRSLASLVVEAVRTYVESKT